MEMTKIFDERLTKDGFGVRVVARFDVSIENWVDAMNSALHVTVDCKVPGSDWMQMIAKNVGLAHEEFWTITGTGVGVKIGKISQVGPRSGRVKLKLKAKIAGKKVTLQEDRFTFTF